MRASLARIGAASLALSLLACGEATPEDVQSRTAPIVTRVIKEVQSSYSAAQNMREVKQLLEGLEIMVPGLAGAEDSMKADFDGEMTDAQIAAEVNELLSTYLFTRDNVESASPDSVTFLLRGSVICKAVKVEECAAPVGGEPVCRTSTEVSQECIKAVDSVELRIVATLVDSDGVDLDLGVGGGPAVITLRLRPDRVSVELSLSGASAAAQKIAELSGETIELPSVMKGVLAASLVINGSGDISLQSAVKQAIHVEGTTGEGAFSVKMEARDPLAELRLRQSPALLSLDLDWGSLELLLPAREVWDQASGTVALVLKGLSAKLASDGNGSLSISNVGLGNGASKLTLNGQPLVQVDLNPADGRALDLTLAPWMDDLPRIKVAPLLDLQVKLNLAPIEPFLDEVLEPWERNESYRFQLTGQGGGEVAPLRESASFAGGLKVLAGQLTLQSLVQPASVSVPAGSCLVWQDQPVSGGHPLLSRFASQPCP